MEPALRLQLEGGALSKGESEMVKCGEEMPVRLVVATDAHMRTFGKRKDQRGAGENRVDLFDAEHARRLLELAAAETNARSVVIDGCVAKF